MQKSLLLLAILFVCGSWTTSDVSSTYLQWDEYRKLSWDDFKGEASITSSADAATTINITAKPFYRKKRLYYQVEAYFIPSSSWFKSKSEELLAHEQLHFDIAELYARKVRKKISEYSQMGIRDVTEYNRAISKILTESNNFDAEYDYSTLHGTLSAKQELWERNVHQELEILKRFSRDAWK